MTERMCGTEKLLRACGFRVIHDGSKSPKEKQCEQSPEEVAFFVRKLRWYLDDEPMRTTVIFKYDNRNGSLITFELSLKDSELQLEGKETVILENSEELAHEITK